MIILVATRKSNNKSNNFPPATEGMGSDSNAANRRAAYFVWLASMNTRGPRAVTN